MTLFQFILTLTKLAAGTALLIWAPHVDHSIAGILLGAGAAVGGGALLGRTAVAATRERKPTVRADAGGAS
jgi:hypothetical protein